MKNNKCILIIIFITILVCVSFYFFNRDQYVFNINSPINQYNLNNRKIEERYLNDIKDTVYPIRLRPFIDIDYVYYDQYSNTATGIAIKNQMTILGYKFLFSSLFDKTRVNFDDCPVTDNFKNKFNTNLTDFFHLYSAEDYNINCSLNMKDNSFTIEIYGIEGYSENLEPNYWNTYNFTYTLDNNGNIDDITKID